MGAEINYQTDAADADAANANAADAAGAAGVDATIGEGEISTKERSGGKAGNRAAREEWFWDLGLGMFIHWSLDSIAGCMISHWMCAADRPVVERFVGEFPPLFNPRMFCADDYALLARQCGMKYMVFTAKHHNGFCMFDTATTDFSSVNTPFGRDAARELKEASARAGLPFGLYFSPWDWHWCFKNGRPLQMAESVRSGHPKHDRPLQEYNSAQMRELLANYGPLDFVFFDGPPDPYKSMAWELQPDILVTRGEMETPEQRLPENAIPGAWEANFTMGKSWSYRPCGETYKKGIDLIRMLVETRAKGGNLLLNVSPDHMGRIPFEQERLLQELGLFLFFNGEGIYGVRPWRVCREGSVWYTKAKDSDTVYAFDLGGPWHYGERKSLMLRGVRATKNTRVEILGQSGEVLEHAAFHDTAATWK
ncbi:MAG: alpha-L-fucosidase, partial [Clostridiales bacterium]|nr:alpha-L-fucosidase [Clostridiales bacterium]